MKNSLYLLLALSLAACGGNTNKVPDNQLAFSDFDAVDGWTGGAPAPTLTKEKAHSGIYSVKVDPANDYSMGYNNELGKMSSGRLKKIKIHAWVFLPNDKATPALVAEVKDNDAHKQITWQAVDLHKEAKGFNKWFEVEKEVAIPETATYKNTLLVYLWRSGSSQPAYLDDLTISKVD